MKTRFKPIRLQRQDKDQVENGFAGVTLKPDIIKTIVNPTEIERFIAATCVTPPDAKISRKDISEEYIKWRKLQKLPIRDNDVPLLYKFLMKDFLGSTISEGSKTVTGFYGIKLKSKALHVRHISSTGKPVQKVHVATASVVDEWTTIAKAADANGVPGCKMSRWIDAGQAIGEYKFIEKVKY